MVSSVLDPTAFQCFVVQKQDSSIVLQKESKSHRFDMSVLCL